MKITFLGTGTSTGVPQAGCPCEVCRSADPNDKRLRSSLMVETEATRIVIDCGPDFRQQMLSVDFRRIDALFITHEHADHVGGLDDVRPFSIFGNVPVYAEPHVLTSLRCRLPYCFMEKKYPGVPQLTLHSMALHETVRVGDLAVQSLRVNHGHLPIYAFRIGPLLYITDMTDMPESEWAYIAEGVELLVVNALRVEPHPTHQTIDEACRFAERVGAARTWFVHMSHGIGFHARRNALLPPDKQLAHDGLVLEL